MRHKMTEKLIRSCSCHKVFPLFLVHKDQQLEFKPQHLTLDHVDHGHWFSEHDDRNASSASSVDGPESAVGVHAETVQKKLPPLRKQLRKQPQQLPLQDLWIRSATLQVL